MLIRAQRLLKFNGERPCKKSENYAARMDNGWIQRSSEAGRCESHSRWDSHDAGAARGQPQPAGGGFLGGQRRGHVVRRRSRKPRIALLARAAFPQILFQQDFSPADWQRILLLIEKATHVEEVAGEESAEEAYMETGILTADRADVMVVVWDGKPDGRPRRHGRRGGLHPRIGKTFDHH